jgi:hypothetical protein
MTGNALDPLEYAGVLLLLVYLLLAVFLRTLGRRL